MGIRLKPRPTLGEILDLRLVEDFCVAMSMKGRMSSTMAKAPKAHMAGAMIIVKRIVEAEKYKVVKK